MYLCVQKYKPTIKNITLINRSEYVNDRKMVKNQKLYFHFSADPQY